MVDWYLRKNIKPSSKLMSIITGLITLFIWAYIYILEIIPVKVVVTPYYTYYTHVSLEYIRRKGSLTWTGYGRIGWCGSEPLRELTYHANPYATMIVLFSFIPIFIIINLAVIYFGNYRKGTDIE